MPHPPPLKRQRAQNRLSHRISGLSIKKYKNNKHKNTKSNKHTLLTKEYHIHIFLFSYSIFISIEKERESGDENEIP